MEVVELQGWAAFLRVILYVKSGVLKSRKAKESFMKTIST